MWNYSKIEDLFSMVVWIFVVILRYRQFLRYSLILYSTHKKTLFKISGPIETPYFIARALVQEPDILLLDEPTSSLDLKHQLEVMEMVDKQTESGITVIMTMHDLNLALRFSERILMLRKGKIFVSGGTDVLRPDNIEKVFGVKTSMAHGSYGSVIVPESYVI